MAEEGRKGVTKGGASGWHVKEATSGKSRVLVLGFGCICAVNDEWKIWVSQNNCSSSMGMKGLESV